MSVTTLIERLEGVIESLDSLEHVPSERRDEIRTKVEDVIVALDEISNEFGDENIDEYYGDDDDDDRYCEGDL